MVLRRIKIGQLAVFLRERAVDVPAQPCGYRQVFRGLEVVVDVGAEGVRAIVAVRRTSELTAPVQVAFYKILEGLESKVVSLCVVIEDIELSVIPGRAYAKDVF